jgi:arylformamidase
LISENQAAEKLIFKKEKMKSTYIDLSHTISDGLITYKGLPAPLICDYWNREDSAKNYDNGESFQIAKIEMVANTGTYIDCPFHRYASGKDFNEIELSSFVDLDAVVIRKAFTNTLAIDAHLFKNIHVRNRAVLIHTGWSVNWNTEKYFENHPYLTEAAAIYLRDAGVKLVGIDSYNIDNTNTRTRPVHSILLGAEILIVEHLCNLSNLPDDNFSFTAVPPKFKGVGSFPVRAFGKVKE